MRRVTSFVGPHANRLRGIALIAVLLATMVAPSGLSAAPVWAQAQPGSAHYKLVTGAGVPLAEGTALLGDGEIYVLPAEGIARVRYYLDPSSNDLELSTVGGKPVAVATKAPFALGGLAARALADGAHTLAAAIDLADGRTVTKTVRAHVSNEGKTLLVEAMPQATLAVTPQADCAPLACSQVKVTAPYNLTFSQNHGGLPDKNGLGTGFTWVDKPTAGGTGYMPENLEVDTAAGVLKITTTGGIAFQESNNQDNALGIGIDAANQTSVLETTLVNFPPMTGEFEQAGLWYGTNNDNYLKLVVVSEPGGPRVQFLEERAGAVAQQVVSPVISVTGASVRLQMVADPNRRTVTGYYSVNGGALQELSRFTVPPALFNAGVGIDPELGTNVFGGIFATDRFLQGIAVFQFDYFSLIGAGQARRIYLPLVSYSAP